MTALRVLAVDDEAPALDELTYLLGEHPAIGEVVGASDATEALRVLSERSVDAAFLDISMPGLSGMELAAVLARYATPPALVFVTAHDDRAVQAFEVGAVDYLLKPLRAQRLSQAIERVLASRPDGLADDAAAASDTVPASRRVDPGVATDAGSGGDASTEPGATPSPEPGTGTSTELSTGTSTGLSTSTSTELSTGTSTEPSTSTSTEPSTGTSTELNTSVIPVERGGVTSLIQRDTISWVEAVGDYARLHTASGSYLVRVTLSTLESHWAEAGFARIHRSYLVALPMVTGLRTAGTGTKVLIRANGQTPEVELPVSRRQVRELKDRLVRDPLRSFRSGRGDGPS